MSEVAMLKLRRLFQDARTLAVEFCERCREVCDAACRADAVVAQARELAFARGVWFL
jgi:hypothetical protein